MTIAERADSDTVGRGALYAAPWRILAGMLAALSGVSLLLILAQMLTSEAPTNPLRLIRVVSILCLLPRVALELLRWLFATDVRIANGTLTLQQRHRRIEIPAASVVAVRPWTMPLPNTGVWLRLRSGECWSYGLAIDDPAKLIERLTDAAAQPALLDACSRPSVVYARAKSDGYRRSAFRLLLKFPIFALAPTLPHLSRTSRSRALAGTA
jgi:apolipoprotein N-acyltransferase